MSRSRQKVKEYKQKTTGWRKISRGDRGIALVTTMMLTLLALAIAFATIYMVIQGLEISGLKKRYSSALGAAKGATEGAGSIISSGLSPDFAAITTINNQACFDIKLSKGRSSWGVCDTGMGVSSASYDIRFDFGNYFAYGKIVDTFPGNTAGGGAGWYKPAAVVEGSRGGSSNIIPNPTAIPYIYTLDIRVENKTNPQDSAEISAVYAH